MIFLNRIRNIQKNKQIEKYLDITYLPNTVREYLIKNRSRVPLHLDGRSENIRFVVFDTETTGLNPEKDKILSIGAVSIKGNTIFFTDSFYRIVYYNQKSSERAAIGIHGILPEQSRFGEELDSVIQDFLQYISDSVLVAHHADFDIGFINRYLVRNYSVKLLNPVIDTAILMRRIHDLLNHSEYDPGGFNLDLDSLAQKFRIGTEGRHNALGDAYITSELFLKLTAKMIRIGRKNLEQWIL